MPVTADQPAPYAPPSAILEIISRRRDRGLTAPINADVLARAGVSSSLIPRTLKSLQTLDLINEQGQPTPTFEAIRVAPTPEFQPRMQEWLKNAYADVFAFVDPSQDDEGKITDAFRSYEPAAQQRRMVILFRDLCMAAGLAPQKPAKTEKPSSTRPAARAPTTRPTKAVPAQPNKRATTNAYGLPPAIAGVVESLPSPEEGWTAAERDKFITTFKAVLDYAIPVVQRKASSEAAE